MSSRSTIDTPGEPATARPVVLKKSRSGRLRADRAARFVVTASGFLIIASILAILFVIAAEAIPLFKPPSATAGQPLQAGTHVFRLGADEYRELTYLISDDGLSIRHTADGTPVESGTPLDLGGAKITAVSQGLGDAFALGLSDGRILPLAVKFSATFSKGTRKVLSNVKIGDPIQLGANTPITQMAYAETPSGPVAAIPLDEHQLRILYIKETTTLMGDVSREEVRYDVPLKVEGRITSLALDHRGDYVFIGTSYGEIEELDLRDKDAEPVAFAPLRITQADQAITALGFLLGDRTLVVGTSSGAVSTWQMLKRNGDQVLVKINDFDPHTGPVTAIAASQRNKGFLTLDNRGQAFVRYGTTGKTLLRLDAGTPLASAAFAPKGDGILAGAANGTISQWTLHNPHPEVTWRSLFGKLWYEGYDEPAYVWQSTGGTDDFESKFSLTPMIYGTLKGTLYALLFAIPIALLGALYASQFMHPSLKTIVKPIIEIMAALPSVVLGFIAGLWLAPLMEKYVPGLLLMPAVISVSIVVALFLWHRLPDVLRSRMRAGSELIFLAPVVLLGGWLSLQLGHHMETWMMAGDYRTWLLKSLGLTFDQRNSLVVGFAMGFAVVPIIFTIAEDALASVPNHLKAGSLALGATPWQTAVRVVLPTASPGIFSAVMIGFGRAVGETMIVLMATGNTPVMNMSIFSGFRALSANIAVELPEAPEGGTLYRVLFLAALLLFAMTFVVNTLAELIRLRLRKRYRVL